MTPILVRQVNAVDLQILVPRLACAFATEPLTQWLVGHLPDPQRRRETMMETEIQYAMPYAQTYTTDDRAGAAIWHPPGIKPTLRRNLRLLVGLGHTVDIWHKSIQQLLALLHTEQARPCTPHYYLAILAVDPPRQAQGIGTALLHHGLARCDSDQVMASLSTDTERKVRFYERFGFRAKTVTTIPQTDCRVWTMWREPQLRSS